MKYPDVKKILLIRLRSIGDLVTITPCTRAVKQTYPNCHLAVAVEKGLEDIFLQNPYVDNIIVIDKKDHSLFKQIKFILSLRKMGFDMIINLHGGPRSCILIMFSGARYRVGGLQKRHHFNWIFNIRVTPFKDILNTNNHIHIVDRHLATLKCAGIEGNDNSLIFNVPGNAISHIDKLMSKYSISYWPIVSLHFPGLNRINRMSEGKIASIADSIIENFNLSVIFTGGKADRDFNKDVLAHMKHKAINLAGEITIGQLGALYMRSLFFMGFDSGPSHIAAAVGTYVISLFGATSVKTWHPWTDKLIIIRKDYECIGCGKGICDYGDIPKCLEDITSKEIIDAIKQNIELMKLLNAASLQYRKKCSIESC